MRCRRCDTENPAGTRFCGECGAPLDRACPACGGTNPGNFKFCGHCGTRLDAAVVPTPSPDPSPAEAFDADFTHRLTQAAPPTLVDKLRHLPTPIAAEHRKVTILFADLKGSTALGEKLSPEHVYEVMNQCFSAFVEAVSRHEGYVDKFTGDGIMALFGAPLAHGDDPQRAVRAALEMQTWLVGFSRDLQQRLGVPFQMRIGLNFGAVVAGGINLDDLRMQYDVLGDPVNVAKRLEEMAEPGSVYVSESVQRLTRREFDYAVVGPLRVKGREGEVVAFRLVGPRAHPDIAQEEEPAARLVGRAREWRAISSAIDDLSARSGRFITVAGEPGIGKTRLLEEAAEYGAALGVATRFARCSERYAHSPFALFSTLLSAICGLEESDPPERAAQRVRDAVCRISPELGEWLPYLVRLARSSTIGPEQAGLDDQSRKRLTVQGLCALLEGLCRPAPLLLILDDLQWIDALSHEVLEAIIPRLARLPLLLLVASRPDTPGGWPASERTLTLTLDVLDREQCLELIGCFVDPEVLPQALLEAILDRSGGNPYYLEEVLRNLIDSGRLAREDGRWRVTAEVAEVDLPDTVYGAIMARLDRIGRIDRIGRSVIQGGSVVGLQFPVHLVQDLLEVRHSLEQTLGRLESLQFLREQTPPPDWKYRFKHTAIRDVAYSTLLLQQRRQLHLRTAELFESLYVGRLSEAAEVLAYHYRMAEAWPRAFEYLVLAGERARELFANADAIRHYSEGLALREKIGSAEDPSRWPHELAAHEGLGEVHARLGDYPASVAAYGRALTCAYLLRLEPHDRALKIAAIKRKTAKCLFETGSEKRAEQLLREAFRAVRSFDDAEVRKEQSAVLADLGFLRWRSGRYSHAMRFGRWSCRLAEVVGSELELGDACNLLGLAAQALGRFDEAVAHYQRVLQVAERTGDVATVGTVLNNLGNLYHHSARFDEAEACYQRAERQWEKMGDVVRLATTLSNAGNVHLARGDFERAVKAYESAIRMFRRANLPFEEAAAVASLGEASLECGRVGEAVSFLTRAQALAEALSVPDLMAYIGSVLAAAYVEQGELDQGERECRRALEVAAGIACGPVEGASRRTLARIARLRGDTSQAEAELAHAQAIFASNDLELGRTLVEHSRLMVTAGRPDAATGRLAEAIELFRRSGAHADQERAEAFLEEVNRLP